MMKGICHCGRAYWTLSGDPGSITACNCTLCVRYGAPWAYDYENERSHISGPSKTYTRVDTPVPALEFHFCPTCACILAWRGLRLEPEERRRIAVNVRLAPAEAVADLLIDHFDGFSTFDDVTRRGKCVKDYWF